MIKIVTTIKQVPDTAKITVNKEDGTLNRKGVPSVLNPYCEWAVEEAVSLKTSAEVQIEALTMGPPSAKEALLRTLSLGVDSATLLTDRKFAGSDCRATAYILAQAIKKIVPDVALVVTGKEAIDGDTAQVPAELSVFLGMIFIPDVVSLESVNDGVVVLIRESEQGREKLQVKTPFVCSVSTGSRVRKLLELPDVIRALSTSINILTADDIVCDETMIGLKGSPTKVIKIENIITARKGKMFFWDSKDEQRLTAEDLPVTK